VSDQGKAARAAASERGQRGSFKSRGLVACVVLSYSANVTLKALIHSADEGGYWAEVPALPGCVSQAETIEEMRANIREAIEAWLLAGDGELKPGATDQLLEVTV
jgi:predicted RNase H-like HicB family nuclease